MSQNSLYQTAIHESGHAVTALVLNRKFNYVTIIHSKDLLGHVKYWSSHQALINRIDGMTTSLWNPETIDRRVRNIVAIAYAGYCAQLHTGVDNPNGAELDVEEIIEIALRHAGEDVDNFLEQCLTASKQIVATHWNHIENIAKELQRRKTLTGMEVKSIMDNNQVTNKIRY